MKVIQVILSALIFGLGQIAAAQTMPATDAAQAIDDLQHVAIAKITSEVQGVALAFSSAKDIQSSLAWTDWFRPALDIALAVYDGLTSIPNIKKPASVQGWIRSTLQAANSGKSFFSIFGSLDRFRQDGANLALTIDGPSYNGLVTVMLNQAEASGSYYQSIVNSLYGRSPQFNPIRISHKSTSLDRAGGSVFNSVTDAQSYIASQLSSLSAQLRQTQLPPDRVADLVSFINARSKDVRQSMVGATTVTYQAYLSNGPNLVRRQVNYSLGTISQLEHWRYQVLGVFTQSLGLDMISIEGTLLEEAATFVIADPLTDATKAASFRLSTTAKIGNQGWQDVVKDATTLGFSIALPDIGDLAQSSQSFESNSREQINMIPQQMMDALPGEISKLLLLVDDTATYAQAAASAPPAPAISYVSPPTLPGMPLGQTQLIRIIGSGFTQNSTLTLNDGVNAPYARRIPAFVSANELDFKVSVGPNPGNWSVVVVDGGQTSNEGRFTVSGLPSTPTGSLVVNIAPQDAVSAGAQWQVDGTGYTGSGQAVGYLTPGLHKITFKPIAGYITPPDQPVTIVANQQATATATYNPIAATTYTLTLNSGDGSMGTITASPPGSATGSSFNYAAGSIVQLTASARFGYHFAGWSGDVAGADTSATVIMDRNKYVSASFAVGDDRMGTIIVTIQPPEAAAAGVTWGFNDGDVRASGTALQYWPGTYFIYVHGTKDWIGSGGWVTVTGGQTTNATFAASSAAGVITGSDPSTYFTIAGLAGSSGSADGVGNTARFNRPWSTAVDTEGNVYVADSWNNLIRKITPYGQVSTVAGLAGSAGSTDGTGSDARFSNPVGIAVDTAMNLYVADLGNSTIRKITPDGVVSTFAGLAGNPGSADGMGGSARFDMPAGVVVDTSGNLYVADNNNQTIRKITPGRVVSTLAGLAHTFGTVDGTGTSARFHGPSALAIDDSGNVFVADTYSFTIRKITSAGVVTTLAGFPGSAGAADGTGNSARFSYPQGIGVTSNGIIYVADTSNHSIRRVTQAGAVTTLAGQSGSPGSADGTGGTVRFNNPAGVSVDRAGNVFVADGLNHTIRATRPPPAKMSQSITFPVLADTSMGAAPFALTATASSGLPVYFDIVSGPASLDTNNVLTLLGGGTVGVIAWQLGNSNYNAAATVQRSFKVAMIPQTISFGPLSPQTVGDAPFPLTATASSGLPVFFTLLSGPAQLTGNILTLTNAGLVVVRASQPGDATNAPAPNVDQTLVVSSPVTPVAITQQPASQTVVQASSVTFAVVAGGTAPLNYQWLFNGTPLNGATLASLTNNNVQITDAGQYSVVVSNAAGSATSAVATLTVIVPPTIATGPANQTAIQGSDVIFNVSASGTTPLGYQWLFNGTPIAGATAASLVKTSVQPTDAGQYSATVTNIAGSATSAVASLTVIVPPTITASPTSQSAVQGSAVVFNVVASGTTPFGYQWLFNGTPIAGATAASLVKSNVQPADAGQYSVAVSNLAGSTTSSNAMLTVTPTTVPPLRISDAKLSGGTFRFTLNGLAGSTYIIQASADLVNWVPISTNTIPAGGSVSIADPLLLGQTQRFYRALSTPTNACTPVPGIVAWWPADGNANDLQAGNAGVLVNGAGFAPGEVGQAFDLHGGSYVEIPDNSILSLGGEFTIELWFFQRTTDNQNGYRLLDKVSVDARSGYLLDTYDGSTGRKLRFLAPPTGVSGRANTVYTLNAWHHAAVTFASGTVTIYLDGAPDGSFPANTPITNNLSLFLGHDHQSTPLDFDGLLDEVTIYNRALSPLEIQKIYATGAAGKCHD